MAPAPTSAPWRPCGDRVGRAPSCSRSAPPSWRRLSGRRCRPRRPALPRRSRIWRRSAARRSSPSRRVTVAVVEAGRRQPRAHEASIPQADYAEPKDAAAGAPRIPHAGVRATLDWHDNPVDVRRLTLRRGDGRSSSTRPRRTRGLNRSHAAAPFRHLAGAGSASSRRPARGRVCLFGYARVSSRVERGGLRCTHRTLCGVC